MHDDGFFDDAIAARYDETSDAMSSAERGERQRDAPGVDAQLHLGAAGMSCGARVR